MVNEPHDDGKVFATVCYVDAVTPDLSTVSLTEHRKILAIPTHRSMIRGFDNRVVCDGIDWAEHRDS